MHDPRLIFGELALREGDRFLDLGCGPGDYAIKAFNAVGKSGVLYALDCWPEMIDELKRKMSSRGIDNIEAMVSDILHRLPIDDNSIDVCFMATVLHALDFEKEIPKLYGEIRRVLKPGGHLAIKV